MRAANSGLGGKARHLAAEGTLQVLNSGLDAAYSPSCPRGNLQPDQDKAALPGPSLFA